MVETYFKEMNSQSMKNIT